MTASEAFDTAAGHQERATVQFDPAAVRFDPAAVRFDPRTGLATGVVQDVGDGRVLMVGWLDREALDATLATREVHFHSRSRGRLWHKGETSGHVLALRGIALDCDGDALLLTVDPAGPTCHRGTRSCFDAADTEDVPQGLAWLEELWATIRERAATRPQGSYTARLIEAGTDAAARKVTEEATELLLAARDDAEAERAGLHQAGTRASIAREAGDLLYHALVLLAERGVEPRTVIDILRARRR